jgi:hypothetical protein
MAKKILVPQFDDLLGALGSQHFAVAPASALTRDAEPRAVLVSANGVGAEIAPRGDGGVNIMTRPSLVVNGELARLVDHGYQKFFETPKVKVPASADTLRALHLFTEGLVAAVGGETYYNEALGTTSDVYMYDRVKGRA